jgi:hypothetical protein
MGSLSRLVKNIRRRLIADNEASWHILTTEMRSRGN